MSTSEAWEAEEQDKQDKLAFDLLQTPYKWRPTPKLMLRSSLIAMYINLGVLVLAGL